jgi:hypothetical protein
LNTRSKNKLLTPAWVTAEKCDTEPQEALFCHSRWSASKIFFTPARSSATSLTSLPYICSGPCESAAIAVVSSPAAYASRNRIAASHTGELHSD